MKPVPDPVEPICEPAQFFALPHATKICKTRQSKQASYNDQLKIYGNA